MPYLFNDQRFNDTLTIDIVSFEQLGLDQYMYYDEQGKSIVLAGWRMWPNLESLYEKCFL